MLTNTKVIKQQRGIYLKDRTKTPYEIDEDLEATKPWILDHKLSKLWRQVDDGDDDAEIWWMVMV